MCVNFNMINNTIKVIQDSLGNTPQLIIKDILIGSNETEACILYIGGLSNKDMIDRDILTPLMLHMKDDINNIKTLSYLSKKYLTLSNIEVSTNISQGIEEIKRGKCLILVNGFSELIIADTIGSQHRPVSDPLNEVSIRGGRESFVENLEVNLSMIKRRLKDKNLTIEKFKLGRRSQTDVVMLYVKDIANESIVNEIRNRINSIDIDSLTYVAILEQMIEKYTYSVFPQVYASERPDIVQANILEGRIAILVDNTDFSILTPALFSDFFQAPDDYLHRTLAACFLRIVRMVAVIIIIVLPALYVSFVKFNAELIPAEAVKSIMEFTSGIAFTPFISILIMNLTVEFLREGGLRLPSKIGQTVSVVGGIIIGDAALRAKIVSPITLLVVGFVTVATFTVPNYEMSLSIRLLSYPMLILGNWLGLYGIGLGCFFLLSYLCSMDSFGIPYFHFHKRDLKDRFIRGPIWKMNERPEILQTKDSVRQGSPSRKSGGSDE
jgi:spore germination protein KA